jgi:hypothetical protein
VIRCGGRSLRLGVSLAWSAISPAARRTPKSAFDGPAAKRWRMVPECARPRALRCSNRQSHGENIRCQSPVPGCGRGRPHTAGLAAGKGWRAAKTGTAHGAGAWRKVATRRWKLASYEVAGNLPGCLFVLKGRWIPPSRQDGFRLGEAPDTRCLANLVPRCFRWH